MNYPIGSSTSSAKVFGAVHGRTLDGLFESDNMRKILATHSLHLVYDCFTSCFRNPDPGTSLDNKIFCRIEWFPLGLCCGIPLSCLPVVSSSLDSILVLVDGRQLHCGGNLPL